jgi:hypothetical protein
MVGNSSVAVPVRVTEVIGVGDVNPRNAVPVVAGVTTLAVDPPAVILIVSVPAPVKSAVSTSQTWTPKAVTPPACMVIVSNPLLIL